MSNMLGEFNGAVGRVVSWNKEPAKILGYLVASQVFKKHMIIEGYTTGPINPRLHFNLFQTQQTGKDTTAAFYIDLARACNLNVCKITTATDAGLIGSIDGEKVKQMRALEKKLIDYRVKGKDEEKCNEIELEISMLDPTTYGMAATADIIYYPEASKMFEMGQYTSESLSNWQMIMDEGGEIEKKLGAYEMPVKYKTTTSLIATSYYISQISEVAIRQGFFQRTLAYFKAYPPDQVKMFVDTLREKKKEVVSGKHTNSPYFEARAKMGDCAKYLLECKEWLKENGEGEGDARITTMKLDMNYFDAEDLMLKHLRKHEDLFHSTEESLLVSFELGMLKTMVKMAAINAALDKRNRINKVDGMQALSILRPVLDSIAMELVARIRFGGDEDIEKEFTRYKIKTGKTGWEPFKPDTLYWEKDLVVQYIQQKKPGGSGAARSLLRQFARLGFLQIYHNQNPSLGPVDMIVYVDRHTTRYKEENFEGVGMPDMDDAKLEKQKIKEAEAEYKKSEELFGKGV